LRAASLTALLLLLSSTALISAATVAASAEGPSPMLIRLDRVVLVQGEGPLVINDTVSLSADSGSAELPRNFSVGFPYQFSQSLDYCFAHEAPNPDARLGLGRGAGLEKPGFYGVSVELPLMEVGEGESYNFTVVFVFSGLIHQAEGQYDVEFPLYPSLDLEADLCNVTVILPEGANYTESTHEFSERTVDSIQVLGLVTGPLEPFSEATELLTVEASTPFLLLSVPEVTREIAVDRAGVVHLSEHYWVVNWAEEALSTVRVPLPRGAYELSARDDFGDLAKPEAEAEATAVSLRIPLGKGEEGDFVVDYRLPREGFIEQEGLWTFSLTLGFSERLRWTIMRLTVSVALPEGAELISQSVPVEPSTVQRDALQDRVTFVLHNATPFQDLRLSVTYRHLAFWASFRPTLWMGALVLIASVAALIVRAPGPTVPAVPIPSDALRGFLEAYEERRKILSELDSVERQAQRGRLPRRRYRARRRTLEGRLSTLSRELTGLRDRMRGAGPMYADMVHTIEVAETQLEEAKAAIERTEARFRRKEISSEAHRRLLEEYHRRRDRAETTIEGLLLRLREETR